jgi:hypothetical protein
MIFCGNDLNMNHLDQNIIIIIRAIGVLVSLLLLLLLGVKPKVPGLIMT